MGTGGLRPSPRAVVLVVALVPLAAYLWRTPPAPDLAAQVARAAAAPATGSGLWWTGWFAGLSLPSYSALTPWVMDLLGAPWVGALAAALALAVVSSLLRSSPRPVLGTVAFASADLADLAVGRVTFAVGLALGALAVWVLHRLLTPWSAALAGGAAALSFLASPLAGLFTGMVALAVVVVDSPRRRAAAVVALVLLACAMVSALLLRSPGTMPTTALDVVPALGAAAAVALLCRPRVVRASALITGGATLLFFLVPGAVGENVTRLAWVAATPALVAFGRTPARPSRLRRRWRAALLAAVALATAVTPGLDVAHQLSSSRDPSSGEAFYRPLVHELEAERARGPQPAGGRVEVVDPRTHWSSVYVADRIPLARGWDRQADAALDPLFYTPGALDADSYRRWLHALAVGWVAVPDTPLDYASLAEARLVASGVPGLRRTWSGAGWTLYQVQDPAPLVEGASLVGVDPSGVTVDVPGAGSGAVVVRVRWDRSLVARSPDGAALEPACLARSATGMVTARLPAGRWRIAPDPGAALTRSWAPSLGTPGSVTCTGGPVRGSRVRGVHHVDPAGAADLTRS